MCFPLRGAYSVGIVNHLPAWLGALLFALAPVGAQQAETYRLLRSFGEAAGGPGQLRGAHGICMDADGNVLVIDSRLSRIFRYTPEGRYVGEIGEGPGSGPGQFQAPRDARVSRGRQIYVADVGNHRIQVLTHEGKFLKSFGSQGRGPGQFLRPHTLDFDPAGRLFLVDVDRSVVDVYDAQDQYVTSWGKTGKGEGEFNAPHGIGCDPHGDVFVSNYYGPAMKFTPEGRLLQVFARIREDGGPFHYHNLSTDREGNVYLMARDRQRRSTMEKFDNQGRHLATWRLPHPENFIQSAAIDKEGRVYVTYQGRAGSGVHVFVRE